MSLERQRPHIAISLAVLAMVSLMMIASTPQTEGSTDPDTVRLDIGPDESLTIMENTILSEGENIIRGKLNVPEGVTLTVQSDSDLILKGGSCEMTVDGTLMVMEGELGISMDDGSRLIINGSMEMKSVGIWRQALVIERDSHSQLIINGTASVDRGVTVYNLDMDYTEMLYGRYSGDDAVPGIVVNGKMTFNGTLNDEAVILVTGELVMGGSYFYGIIYNHGGKVLTTEQSGVHCHITDLGMDTDKGAIVCGQENDILFTDISGMTVTSTMENGRNELHITGDLHENGIWRGKCGMSLISGDGLFIDGPMRIDGLDINDDGAEEIPENYTLTITGNVEAYDATRMLNRFAMFGPGNIVIEGTLSLPREMQGDLPVTAAMYTKGDRCIYTSIGNALSSGQDHIVLQGDVTISDDMTVPEGTTLETAFDLILQKDTRLHVKGTFISSDGTEYSGVTLIGDGSGFHIDNGKDLVYTAILVAAIVLIVIVSLMVHNRKGE